ncbi:MAG: hypothetical protein D6814_01125, partial [Calditrichaeota bacterium]
ITSLVALRRFAEAEESAREAVQIKDDYLDGYYHLSAVCYMQKKFAEAVKYGRKYLQLLDEYRDHPQRYANLNIYTLEREHRFRYWFGTSLIAIGEQEEGMANIEKGIEHPFGKHNMAIESLHNVLALSNEETARKLFQKMYLQYCQDGDFVLLLAHELAMIDHLIWLQEFIRQRQPGEARDFGAYGQALLALLKSDTGEARAYVQALLKDQPEHLYGKALADILRLSESEIGKDDIYPSHLLVKIYTFLHDITEILQQNEDPKFLNLRKQEETQGVSESEILDALLETYILLQAGQADELVMKLQQIASRLNSPFPESIDEVRQVLEIVVNIANQSDLRGLPDAANLALAIAHLYFGGDVQLQGLLLNRRIQRASREGSYPIWAGVVLKYLFPGNHQGKSGLQQNIGALKRQFKRATQSAGKAAAVPH